MQFQPYYMQIASTGENVWLYTDSGHCISYIIMHPNLHPPSGAAIINIQLSTSAPVV